MKYIFLSGKNLKDESSLIKQTIDENPETIFIYNGLDKIYEYIDYLTEDYTLDEEYICKFKLCYEKTDLNLSLTNSNVGFSFMSVCHKEKPCLTISQNDLIAAVIINSTSLF